MTRVSHRQVPIDLAAADGPAAPLPLLQPLTVTGELALNTYVTCEFRCRYCITNAQGRSEPRYGPRSVKARLAHELEPVGLPVRITVGAYCDVYPRPEVELRVTRAALEVLAERSIGFRLITKGPAVVRDIDLFGAPETQIMVSLNSLDDEAIARLEPGAPTAAERLAALAELAAAGLRTVLQLSPWIPGVSDVDQLLARVDPAIEVVVTPLRLPPYLRQAKQVFSFTQAEINAAYRAAYERVAPRPNLGWSRPPSLDSAPPHISDNLPRAVIEDWMPAPPAPDPGLLPWWGPGADDHREGGGDQRPVP